MKRNGPPKKPTNLKLLHGTFRKDRANEHEPQPTIAIPPVPEHLSSEAKAEYERIAKNLERLGLISDLDRGALSIYCEAWSDWVTATIEVQRRGMVLKTKAGNVVENPFYSIKKRAAELMHKILTEFGLSPASRARLSVRARDEEDSFEKWMREKG